MCIEQHLAPPSCCNKEMHKTGHRNKGFIPMLPQGILNAHRADLNMHTASPKRIENKNDNLNDIA
jgi:hypothetical protein